MTKKMSKERLKEIIKVLKRCKVDLEKDCNDSIATDIYVDDVSDLLIERNRIEVENKDLRVYKEFSDKLAQLVKKEWTFEKLWAFNVALQTAYGEKLDRIKEVESGRDMDRTEYEDTIDTLEAQLKEKDEELKMYHECSDNMTCWCYTKVHALKDAPVTDKPKFGSTEHAQIVAQYLKDRTEGMKELRKSKKPEAPKDKVDEKGSGDEGLHIRVNGTEYDTQGNPLNPKDDKCPSCGGIGRYLNGDGEDRTCLICNGTGIKPKNESRTKHTKKKPKYDCKDCTYLCKGMVPSPCHKYKAKPSKKPTKTVK